MVAILSSCQLLSTRMQGLNIEPSDFSRAEPAVFEAIQGLCAKCDNASRCAHDVEDEFADPAWQEWRDYCPVATTLSTLGMISTLQ